MTNTFQTSFRWPLQLGCGYYSADEWNESTALSATSTAEYVTYDHLPFLPGNFLTEKHPNATSKQQVEGRRSGNANKSTLGGGSTSISGGGGLEPTLELLDFCLANLMPGKLMVSLVELWGPGGFGIRPRIPENDRNCELFRGIPN